MDERSTPAWSFERNWGTAVAISTRTDIPSRRPDADGYLATLERRATGSLPPATLNVFLCRGQLVSEERLSAASGTPNWSPAALAPDTRVRSESHLLDQPPHPGRGEDELLLKLFARERRRQDLCDLY